MNNLFVAIMQQIKRITGADFDAKMELSTDQSEKIYIIPPDRIRYLAEIAESSQLYNEWVDKQSAIARKMFQLKGVIDLAEENKSLSLGDGLVDAYIFFEEKLDGECRRLLRAWPATKKAYKEEFFIYKVRDKEIKQPLFYESLSKLNIPKVSLHTYEG